jgi:hypothetical protein
MNRLATVWLRGADVLGLDRLASGASGGARIHRYRVDGSVDEHLIWIEARAGEDPGWSDVELSPPSREVFTFDLARDVGVKLQSPAPWLYIVHTDIPADIGAAHRGVVEPLNDLQAPGFGECPSSPRES